MDLKKKDVPEAVRKAVASMKDEFKIDGDLEVGLLSLVNSLARNPKFDGMSKARLFNESLDILHSQIRTTETFTRFKGFLSLGITSHRDWERKYRTKLEKDWNSGDPEIRRQMIADGTVQTAEVIEDGEKVRKIISTFKNWDAKGGQLKWGDATYWEEESDPITFVDTRKEINGRENFRYMEPVRARWSARHVGITGIEDDNGNIMPVLAMVKHGNAAADPSSKYFKMKGVAGTTLKWYPEASGQVQNQDDGMLYIRGREFKVGGEPDENIKRIEETVGDVERVDRITTADLPDWINRFASRDSPEQDWNRFFLLRCKISRVQKWPSGGVAVHVRDKFTPDQYDYQGNLPDGTTLEDFGVAPGQNVLLFGRAWMGNSVYNYTTGTREDIPWPRLAIGGLNTTVDFLSDEISEILSNLDLDLTDEGE